ncbi:MAG: hypothetical protein GWN05_03605 [Gammaproteobacteria bacterium]|nr:hypothetical protein [Gammaproteobacteria bacterium]
MTMIHRTPLLACAALACASAAGAGPTSGEPVTIMGIQGRGQFSPMAGRIVTTGGVVTLHTAKGSGFWIQDPDGDGDFATSDGVFVAARRGRPPVGAKVTVTGRVQELRFGDALPLTRLTRVREIRILARGQPLPAPIPVTAVPGEGIIEAIDFWEPLEGMRVSVTGGRVVSPTSRFGEFTLLAPGNARPGSGYFPDSGHLLLGYSDQGVDYNPERILVDDASLPRGLILRPGDGVDHLVGVVDYRYGNYKIQPGRVQPRQFGRRPEPPAPGAARGLTVATFNVGGLFDRTDDPHKDDERSTPSVGALETKLSKLVLALEGPLGLPAILVVQEVENTEILRRLGDRVNARGDTAYRAVSVDSSDPRGIEVGLLWDADRAALERAFRLHGRAVEAAFGRRSASPGREPLVGVFEIAGERLIVVGCHFKSKRGDDPLFGLRQPPVRGTEAQRKAQARAVREYVDEVLAAEPGAMVIVAGDLNDFPFPEPGEGADHPLAILEGADGETPLTNLVRHVDPAGRYTFVFDGNSQVLDYLLVSPALRAHLQEANIVHFNAGYPHALADDPATALRASDHDAVAAHFDLGP